MSPKSDLLPTPLACLQEGTANGGNRYLTVLMYLNDGASGM